MAGHEWPDGKIAAISLTYDGTLPEHLIDALPALVENDLKGTFYAYPPNLLNDPDGWRSACRDGHEIGNHPLYEAVDKEGLLPELPFEAIEAEVEDGKHLCQELGCQNHSFAYPAVATFSDNEGLPVVPSMVRETIVRLNGLALNDAVEDHYEVARSPIDGFNLPGETDLLHVKSYSADGLDGESLTVLAQMGISQHAWVVLVFSGLMTSGFDPKAHQHLCRWLSKQHSSLFIAPVVDVAATISSRASYARTL